MFYLNNYQDINFDDFHHYPSKTKSLILNDFSLLQIMLKKNISEKRFIHSLNVAKTAMQLATYHHFDTYKAYLAGLLHDCTKDFDERFHNSYLQYYDKEKLSFPKEVKHSYSAKYYLKEKLNLHYNDVLNAIYNHTICKSRDKLSLILFIADKREEGRMINDDILQISYKNIYLGYEMLSKDVERYLLDKNG